MKDVPVRMHRTTKQRLDVLHHAINMARQEAGKVPITKAQLMEIAVVNLPIELGVSK